MKKSISWAAHAAIWTLVLNAPTWAQETPKPDETKPAAPKSKLEIVGVGELRIDGKITALLGAGTWQIEAVSWTSPRGVTTDFEEVKNKSVKVGAAVLLHPRGEATKVALKDVKLGSRVAIIGKNGPDGSLVAREVILLEGFGQTKTIGLIMVNQLSSQLLTQGRSARDGGQQTRAISLFNQALSAAQGVGDRPGQALSLQNLGTLYLEMGQNDKATDAFNRSVEVARGTSQEASAYNGLGLVHLHEGDFAAAITALENADRVGAEADPRARVIYLGNLAGAYRGAKRTEDAIRTLQRVFPLEVATAQPHDATETLISIASLMAENQPDGARDYLKQASPRLADLPDQKKRASLTLQAAIIAWKVGDQDAAKTQIAAAAKMFDEIGETKSAQIARDLPAKLEANPTADVPATETPAAP